MFSYTFRIPILNGTAGSPGIPRRSLWPRHIILCEPQMQIDPRTSKTSQRTWQGYCMLLWVIALPCGITLGEKHGWLLPSLQTFLLIKMPLLPCADPANPLRTQTAWSVEKWQWIMMGSWCVLISKLLYWILELRNKGISLSRVSHISNQGSIDSIFTYALNNSRAFICESYFHIISSIQWQMYLCDNRPKLGPVTRQDP